MRIFFKLYKSVNVWCVWFLFTREFHNLTLTSWWRENTFGHSAVMVYGIVVNLDSCIIKLHQVELIIGFLHDLLPVIIVVVVTVLQELSRNEFRLDVFLLFFTSMVRQFHSLASTLPTQIKQFIYFSLVLLCGPDVSLFHDNFFHQI